MKAVLQRVARAEVRVDGQVVGRIDHGLLVLLGVAKDDPPGDELLLAKKTAGLRIFADEAGKMNRSVGDVGGAVLVVSQFTLLADTAHGRRPSFLDAAPPAEAEQRYLAYCQALRGEGLTVETGRFGALMEVELVNMGPVTILLESAALR